MKLENQILHKFNIQKNSQAECVKKKSGTSQEKIIIKQIKNLRIPQLFKLHNLSNLRQQLMLKILILLEKYKKYT